MGLLAESGCSKSTFAKVLMGLETATSGQLLFDGRNTEALPIEARDAKTVSEMQMVFQTPFDTLTPSMTLGRQIIRALEIFGVGRRVAEGRERMLQLLAPVKLPREFSDRMPRCRRR